MQCNSKVVWIANIVEKQSKFSIDVFEFKTNKGYWPKINSRPLAEHLVWSAFGDFRFQTLVDIYVKSEIRKYASAKTALNLNQLISFGISVI